jgi:hypothetical protein
MMISSELEIVALIVALYGSTCVVLACADEGVLQQSLRGMRLQVADDRLRLAGRSPLWLNPLLPMRPAFRGQWGNVDSVAAAPGLAARIPEVTAASMVLAPYVFAVFLCTVVGVPLSLLLVGAKGSVPVIGLAYFTVVALLVRLWFLRGEFLLDGRRFALLAFESIACPPFAAGLVRRLSLAVPVTEDLASFVIDMTEGCRRQAIEALMERCGDMKEFFADDPRTFALLTRYWVRLAGMAGSYPDAPATAAVSEET